MSFNVEEVILEQNEGQEFIKVSPVVRFGSAILVLLVTVLPGVEIFIASILDGSKPNLQIILFAGSICIIGIGLAWMIFRKKTMLAVKKQLILPTESENIEPTQLEKMINELAEKWWARYIAGAVLFVVGGFLLDHFVGLETAKRWNSYIHYWLAMFALFGWGIICMKEVFGFVIFALIFGGIAYALFGLLAGVPVSLAIIIGAMIIAKSNNKN